jgi:hypothetical protein
MSMSMRLSIAPDPDPDDGGEIIMETTMSASVEMTDGETSGGGVGRHETQLSTGGDGLDGLLEFDNKRAKIDYFSKDCTEITNYLYVGGKKVASSEEKLKEKGITHIISQSRSGWSDETASIAHSTVVVARPPARSHANHPSVSLSVVLDCCGDVCENYFPDDFHYLKLHLLDSAAEDIVCVLYKVIDFIDAVRKGKNKVLVHCQQVRWARTCTERGGRVCEAGLITHVTDRCAFVPSRLARSCLSCRVSLVLPCW